MKKELTERQKEILKFIQEFIEAKGYSPSFREIGKYFGISSTFGVKRHLDALVKKGYLNSESHISRAISLTENSSNSKMNISDLFSEIPIVGRVAAGTPILAVENLDGNLVVDKSLLKNNPESFALKVKGDSMINAGIYEGDLIVVSPTKFTVNGDIVVALLGDEATVKRFERKGNQTYLIPENNNYPPIPVTGREDFSIVGKVIGVIRWYN